MQTVVFVLTRRVHLLDLAGPAQVFSMAGEFGAHYRLIFVADEVEVLSAQGLRVAAQTQWPDLGPDDLVIVPLGVLLGLIGLSLIGQTWLWWVLTGALVLWPGRRSISVLAPVAIGVVVAPSFLRT